MRSTSWNTSLDPSCACLLWLMKTWILMHNRPLLDLTKASLKVLNLTVHILKPSFLIFIHFFWLRSKLSHTIKLRVNFVKVFYVKHDFFRLHCQIIVKLCIFLPFKLQKMPDLTLNLYHFLFVVFESWLIHLKDRSAYNEPSVNPLNLDCCSDIDVKRIHDWFWR